MIKILNSIVLIKAQKLIDLDSKSLKFKIKSVKKYLKFAKIHF